MLDDLKFIHEKDPQDALGIAEKEWQQLEHSFEVADSRLQIADFTNIVYAGMGGSALAALLSKSWPGYKMPFEICRQYKIPAYVSEKTLFIASSYSGNTEETLTALTEAEGKGAKIATIASGGKLEEISKEKNYPLLLLPKVNQPRYAVFANLKALIVILEAAGCVDTSDATAQLEEAASFLAQKSKNWLPTVHSKENLAKKLALEIAGKSPAIYAGPLLAPAAYKWKIGFNENSKSVAWWNELPEFDHNELTGWSSHPIEKPYAIIELRSNLENPRVQKRFEVGERLLSGLRPAPMVINVEGETILEQLVWAVCLGDFVSIYLAFLNGVNPAPVDLVEKLKKELNK